MSTPRSRPPWLLLLFSLLAATLAYVPLRLQPTPMTPASILRAVPADAEVALALQTADPEVRQWLGVNESLLGLPLRFPADDQRGALFYRRGKHQQARFFQTPPPPVESPISSGPLRPLFASLPAGNLGWLVVRRPGLELVAALSLEERLVTCRWVASMPDGPTVPPGRLNFETLDFFAADTPYLGVADVGRALESNPELARQVHQALKGYHLDPDKDLLPLLGSEMAFAGNLAVFHLEDPAGWKALLEKKLPAIVSSNLATFYRQGATITTGLDDTIAWATTADFAVFGLDQGLEVVETALTVRNQGQSLWLASEGAWLRAQAGKYDLVMAVRQSYPGLRSRAWLAIEGPAAKMYRGIGCLELEESTIR